MVLLSLFCSMTPLWRNSEFYFCHKNSLCQSLRGWIRLRAHASAMTNTGSVCPACSELCWGQWPGYCWVWKAAFHPNSSEYWVLEELMLGEQRHWEVSYVSHRLDWGKVWVSSIHMYLCIVISWQIYASLHGHHAAMRQKKAPGHQAWHTHRGHWCDLTAGINTVLKMFWCD